MKFSQAFSAGMVDIYGAPRAMPPDAAAIYASTNARFAARVTDAATDGDGLDEVREHIATATAEELEGTAANYRALIKVISNERDDDGSLPARQERRLEQAENVLALVEAKLSESTGRKTKPADPSRIAAGSFGGGERGAGNGLSQQGGLIPQNCADPHGFIYGTRASSGARSVAEFLASCRNPNFQAASGSEGIGTDGGFAVPTTLHRAITTELMETSQLWRLCRQYPVDANNATIALPDVMNQLTALAGLSVTWTAENAAQTGQILKWREIECRLHKLMCLAEASSELAEDAPGYAAMVSAALGADAGLRLDHALIAGSGVGTPTGYLNATSTLEIDPESGQAADTIVWQNVVNLFSRLHPACKRRAVWMASPDVMQQLLGMTLPNGNPALLSGGYNDGGAGSPAPRMLGLPIIESTLSPVLGNRGDLALVDFSQVAMIQRAAMRISYTDAAAFERDAVIWKLRWRVDAQPIWDEAFTPRNGGATLSWATVLGPRA